MIKLLGFALWLLVLVPALAHAQAGGNAPSDDWEFALTPALWGAGMDGTVGFAGQQVDFAVSAKDLLDSLDFAFLTNFEARKSRWSFSGDLFFVDLTEDVEPANPNVPDLSGNPRLDMSMTLVEGDVGYQVAPSLDVLAGVRSVSTTARVLSDRATFPEAEGGFTDPIVGARFRRYLSEKFWVQLRGDVGGFGAGSDFSWFIGAVGGLRLARFLSLDFGYRTWSFDYESDDDLGTLNLTLAGFGGGVTFHF